MTHYDRRPLFAAVRKLRELGLTDTGQNLGYVDWNMHGELRMRVAAKFTMDALVDVLRELGAEPGTPSQLSDGTWSLTASI